MSRLRPTLAALLLLAGFIAACGSSAQEECSVYLFSFAGLVEPAGDVLVARADEFRAYAEGDIELAQLSDALARSETEMGVLLANIDALGEPPEELAEGVESVVQGITHFREAFALDDGLGLVTSPDLLDQYVGLTQEGATLTEEGTDALGDCVP